VAIAVKEKIDPLLKEQVDLFMWGMKERIKTVEKT